ncbi:MAG: DUF342 domain-containing protein [Candidatus Cloacimonetes bacterium]|nr:DUF342 domain-containing protein [Candidatus Cloacimonadota bacterium]
MKKNRIFTNDKENISLEISEDSLSAYLTIKESSKFINEKEILDILKKAGIKKGFNRAREFLNLNLIKKEFDKPFLIALRTDIEDMDTSYLFDTGRSYDPDNFISVFELSDVEVVKKDGALAQMIFSNSKGEETLYDIFGNEIDLKEVRSHSINNFLGKNVYFSPEKNQILAEMSGYPYVDSQEKINVESDFELNESFSKVSLDIKGNFIINGNINQSKIYVDGNLKVNGNIKNCLKYGLFVNGDVEFKSAENSKIACKGKMVFNKNARFCVLSSDEEIIGGEDSLLIGGLTQSGKSIEITNIGSSLSVPTEVEITIAPYLKERMINLTGTINDLKKNQKVDTDKISEISGSIKNFEKEIEDKMDLYFRGGVEEYYIKAREKVFADTRIRILNKTRILSKEMSEIILSLKKGELNINGG